MLTQQNQRKQLQHLLLDPVSMSQPVRALLGPGYWYHPSARSPVAFQTQTRTVVKAFGYLILISIDFYDLIFTSFLSFKFRIETVFDYISTLPSW